MLAFHRLLAAWQLLLATFHPIFARASTFTLFTILATGLVASTAHRTVVGILTPAQLSTVVSFQAAGRFFSHADSNTDRLGVALARLIVARLLDPGQPITVVVDDTLVRRWGRQVHHAFWTHDDSAQGPAKISRGNRWVIAGIVARLPFCSHPLNLL